MSSAQQPHEHPGPEWVERTGPFPKDSEKDGEFVHPSLDIVVPYNTATPMNRGWAVAYCRAISDAALEWEFRRGVAFGQGLANASNFQHLIRGLAQ